MSLLKSRSTDRKGKKPVHINLTGAWYSSRNAGDQAILVTIRELLEDQIPDLHIDIICANDTFVREEHGLNAISQRKDLLGVFRSVMQSRALLLGGGTPFYNEFKHMCFFWVLSVICKLSGGKLVIYGASAQKLHQKSARWFTRRIMNMADLITVREPVTKEQLENNLGVKNPVICTADPAITLKACDEERIDEILYNEGLTGKDTPIFAICPHFFSNTDPYRVHHYEAFEDDHIERQRNVLADAANFLSKHGKVIFLPMNTDPPDSDIDVQNEIRARVSNPQDITFIETQYRPREIAGIFSRCKLVVGVRLHSLIMAAAVKTPIIAINYAPKVEGFMTLIGELHHCLRIQKLESMVLKEKLEDYLDNYDEKLSVFSGHVAQVQEKAVKNAAIVAELIR